MNSLKPENGEEKYGQGDLKSSRTGSNNSETGGIWSWMGFGSGQPTNK